MTGTRERSAAVLNHVNAPARPAGIAEERVKSAGLGQIAVSNEPDDILVAYGLGSCVAVVGYDPAARVGGLLHALLPFHRDGDANMAKFVDTGIPLLVRQMEKLGADRCRTVWYVVGGAEMLHMTGLSPDFNIGARNSEAARTVMAREGLPVKRTDVGGTAGRTVKLNLRNGTVTVRVLGQGEKAL